MRYVTAIFWSLLLGQIVGCLGSSLAGAAYDAKLTALISLFVAFVVITIGTIAPETAKNKN